MMVSSVAVCDVAERGTRPQYYNGPTEPGCDAG